jgi:hypothetical protein
MTGGRLRDASGTALGRFELMPDKKIAKEDLDWVVGRISRDGRLHENERALLMVLKSRNDCLHPKLDVWIDSTCTASPN